MSINDLAYLIHTLVDLLTRFRVANSHHPIIFVGDFNLHECEWLGSSFTSATGAALRGFCDLYGFTQMVDQGTSKDAIVDLAIGEYTGTVSYGIAHIQVYKLTHVTHRALRNFACNSCVGPMRHEEYTARERLLMT